MAELLELVLETALNSQICVNRWNYLVTGVPASLTPTFALVKAFGAIESGGSYPSGTVFKAIRDLITSDVQMLQIRAINVYDLEDFYQTPFVPSIFGLVNDTVLSPTVAYGFLSTQVRRDIRHATKRFVGVGSAHISDGGLIEGASATAAVALADAMGEVLVDDDEGSTLSFTPCVVKREKYTVPGSSPARFAYRYYLPEDMATQFENIAEGVTWSPYDHTRTQTSRQYGRGM